MTDASFVENPALAPQRVKHEIHRRRLTVKSVQAVTPRMIRITLEGPELAGFVSAGFDDHVKLIFADADAPPPGPGEEPPRPQMRDFTPRRYDAAAGTLEIDFALHDAGPATAWASQAKPGDTLMVGGPRGSWVLPTGYDWHLLIGDETALPAISRRLAELPAGAHALVVAEVDGPDDQYPLGGDLDLSVTWVHRNGAEPGSTDLLAQAVAGLTLPQGEYFAWAAAEASAAKAIRAELIGRHGANPKRVKAAGYWRRGDAAVHEPIND